MRRSYRAYLQVLGTVLLVTAGALLLPIVAAIFYGGPEALPLMGTMLGSGLIGGLLSWLGRGEHELDRRDALIIATGGWVLMSAVSAIPFVWSGSVPSFTDAFFEMMSGYTTTGATILPDIEALPKGLLLWRSETHLLGGMGFLTLAVVFLPHGTGGLRLFRAESSPGQAITRERLMPRNRDAMKWLWGIYLGLNALQILLMMLGGMPLFDSLCHAFGTVSTSGYSPYNASIGHYNSLYFDTVITVFMFLGGVAFTLYYPLLRGRWRPLWHSTELRWYLAISAAFCLAVSGVLWAAGTYDSVDALRHGSFQVVSLLTTTGFTTTDYELWPQQAQTLLFVISLVGACAGSTTSGIKIVHFVLVLKFGVAWLRQAFIQPLAVVSVRLDGHRVGMPLVHLALSYVVVNIFLVMGGAVVMSMTDALDPFSALSAAVSALMNIGPGFGAVGPSHDWSFISDAGTWFLAWLMLVGRLEMFTALAVFYPSVWRR